jgi:hypothetical protein
MQNAIETGHCSVKTTARTSLETIEINMVRGAERGVKIFNGVHLRIYLEAATKIQKLLL